MFNEGRLLKDCRPGGHTRFVVLLGSGLCTSPFAAYLTTYAFPFKTEWAGGRRGRKKIIYEGLEHFIFYLLIKVLGEKMVSFCLN